MLIREQLPQYFYLMRLDKPIGILLLLWPTLWALWLAGAGHPDTKILIVFVAGVFCMRSAGCVVNDFADRHVDGFVQRTQKRPLVTGKVSSQEALALAGLLGLCAFLLVLLCNHLTIALAFMAAAFTLIYPFLKRFTYLPQCGLGIAFNWGVPMAFAALTGTVSLAAWFLFLTCALWSIIYDTMYAMADKADDVNIGVKSTAILFGAWDKLIIRSLQLLFLVMLALVGSMFHLQNIYYMSLLPVAMLCLYQQCLIKERNAQQCLNAFLNNNWIGLIIFASILLSYI